MDCVIFDLDGTIANSGEGIIKCAEKVFEYFNMPVPPYEALTSFVGPPLYASFEKFGIPKDEIDRAITVYRKRYNTVGKLESFIYDGIEPLLYNLKNSGKRLFVATAKPQNIAVQMLQHFKLDGYFEYICGASEDKKRREKAEVISHLLNICENISSPVMVGDTMTDVQGASANGIPTVAVLWGYGNEKDLIENAAYTVKTPKELYLLLESLSDVQ